MKLPTIALVALTLAAGCGAQQLSAQQQGDVAITATEIAVCQAETRKCEADAGDAASRCWGVYDLCMVQAGLKDGGSHD